jgi:hypothetical protein
MTTETQRKKWKHAKKRSRAARAKIGFKSITIECHADDAQKVRDFAKSLKESKEKEGIAIVVLEVPANSVGFFETTALEFIGEYEYYKG